MNGESGLDLADAIEDLRAQLAEARARGAGADLHFPIRSVSVELQLVAVREGKGKAGFKVPVINLELGAEGSLSREVTHRVVIELSGPVGPSGKPVRVDRVSTEPLD
jgi:Trypsin-co-occurring domain 2